MALTEKIKEIIGVLTDSINPIPDDVYDDDIETNYDSEYPIENNYCSLN